MIRFLEVAGVGLIFCVVGLFIFARNAKKDPQEGSDDTTDFIMKDHAPVWRKKKVS